MFSIKKSILLVISIIMLVSCDAMLHMAYTVENKSKEDIKIFVPNYPIEPTLSNFGERKDTTIILKPDEKALVGIGSKIDFPWGTKNIYKNQPGICGIKKIKADTSISLGCSTSEWKYRKGRSILKIK